MSRPRSTFLYALCIVSASAACLEPAPREQGDTAGSSQRPIIGGSETAEFPAVALIEIGTARCTATLIAPRVLLTAAHCLYDSWLEGGSRGRAYFGPSKADGESVDIEDVVPHFLYRPDFIREADIGLVRLSADPPGDIEPIVWNRAPIDLGMLGTAVTVVGFGVTDGESQTGAGVKREVGLTIDEITEQLIGLGDDTENICQGDSGGPTFLDVGGALTVLGVSSFGSNFCRNRSFITRTDVYADFIDEVVAAWSGPCQNDLTCVTDGCGDFPDPDCGTCGLEGVCGENCERRDLDCPGRGVPGEVCESDADCELGMCLPAVNSPGVSICSEPCDPEAGGADCSRNLEICAEVDGQWACMFEGLVPRTQGAPCEDGGDCNSGLCDSKHEICVELCDGECADPYDCESFGDVSVCTFADGGCCRVADGRGPAPGTLGLASLVLLFLWRRRRKVR